MRISLLSSGSKANSTFVEAGDVRFLIDCGLSGKQTELRLNELGVDPTTIKFIVISHEHSDHIRGVGTFSRKHKIPVFVNEATKKFLPKSHAFETFVTGDEISFSSTGKIKTVSIPHDAADPVGFTVTADGLKLGHVTDIGRSTSLVKKELMGCHVIVLESNHDPTMLIDCGYPWDLKARIQSTHGHLSNEACGGLLLDVLNSDLQAVFLAHISENSNTTKKALETVTRYIPQGIHLQCGTVGASTGIFSLS